MSAAVPTRDGRFLIVGGASLVGSASAELMPREVVILDRFYQGTREAIAQKAMASSDL